MKIETKYNVGQEVFLFNAVSQKIEKDEVFAVLVSPEPVEGKEMDATLPVSKHLADGNAVVGYRYQLQHHQGLLDEKILFASEDELKVFFREFFK
jgi:hypothetical protein